VLKNTIQINPHITTLELSLLLLQKVVMVQPNLNNGVLDQSAIKVHTPQEINEAQTNYILSRT